MLRMLRGSMRCGGQPSVYKHARLHLTALHICSGRGSSWNMTCRVVLGSCFIGILLDSMRSCRIFYSLAWLGCNLMDVNSRGGEVRRSLLRERGAVAAGVTAGPVLLLVRISGAVMRSGPGAKRKKHWKSRVAMLPVGPVHESLGSSCEGLGCVVTFSSCK